MKPLFAAVALAACGLLAGCDTFKVSGERFLGVITPYRVEIVQGNVVTKEQLAAIKPGMTRQQVREVLGSPLLTDLFHADRWDYVFTIKRQGTPSQHRRVVVFFDNDVMKSVEAPDDVPTEQEFVASITRLQDEVHGKPPVLELTPEQRAALPVPPRPAQAASQPGELPGTGTGPQRPYPPLDAAS